VKTLSASVTPTMVFPEGKPAFVQFISLMAWKRAMVERIVSTEDALNNRPTGTRAKCVNFVKNTSWMG